jgi:hypothetical protein
MLMVEHFHSTLENGALGPEDPDSNLFNIDSLNVKSKTIRPQCEQPINYNYEIINAATGTAEIETPTALSNFIPSGSNYNKICLICTYISTINSISICLCFFRIYIILVTPVCTNENINTPWVTSLGFTYKKQGQPVQTWMNETLREHKIPLGGEIVFYCADASRRKRPKKDNFDDDPDDGLLYGYCTYAGTVSIQ